MDSEPGDRLAQSVDYSGGTNVTRGCGSAPFQGLAVEVHKPEARDTWASDFALHYVINGWAKTTNFRSGVALCENKGCGPFMK